MSCAKEALTGLKATASLVWVHWQALGSDELGKVPVSCDNAAPMGLEATASLEEVPQQATGLQRACWSSNEL